MLTAITHIPSPLLNQCELTFLPSRPINLDMAAFQHRAYCDMLRSCGATVVTLDRNTAFPDSVFVEDTALVLDEIGIVTAMGAVSRQAETEAVACELTKFRRIERILPPATLEGGDVLQVGRCLYVGRSPRTNSEGEKALARIVEPFGYRTIGVKVQGCLHLKTGCTALDDTTVLINPEWIDPQPFNDLHTIAVSDREPFAANILRIGQTLCVHSGFAQTRERLERIGYDTKAVDISEFLRAEAGMTCMSLLFDSRRT